MKGICKIYKRANLVTPEGSKILDYSNGTKDQECEVVMKNGFPTYIWKVAGKEFLIPLNVSRANTSSIVEKGEFLVGDDGVVQWEYIYGKYREKSSSNMYWVCLLLFVCILVLSISVLKNN
jgi:hypothetical protein